VIVVTGGAGFVGSHLVDRLLAEGHGVDVIDDLSTGSLGNLAEARNHGRGELRFDHLDVRAPELVEVFQRRRPQIVHHLALLGPGQDSPSAVDNAVSGTLNVLEAARRSGVSKVVVTLPAIALYGDVSAREMPIKEGRAHVPVTLAGVAARTVVDLLGVYRTEYALEFTALALSEVYGPRQRPGDGYVASVLAARADGETPRVSGDGRQYRDFLFVDDAVDAVVRAGERGSGLVINIGTGVLTPVRTLVDLVHPAGTPLATAGPRAAGEPDRFSLSPVRARIHLAWAPWTSVADGVAACLAAQRNRSS
jgi:UDP-glucose 4-epimerase